MSLFKSIYEKFSASRIDRKSSIRLTETIMKRTDIDAKGVVGVFDLLEKNTAYNSVFFESDLKGFFKNDANSIKYIEQLLAEARINDFSIEEVLDSKFWKSRAFSLDLEDFAEFNEFLSILDKHIDEIRRYLAGKSQIRYIKEVLKSPDYKHNSTKTIIEIPLIFELREYWDIVGSLKEASHLYEVTIPIFKNAFLNNSNNEHKKHIKHSLFLN